MDQRQFRDIVASDVKGRCTPAARQMLDRQPGRWLASLEELLADLDRQRQVFASVRAGIEERVARGDVDDDTVAAEQDVVRKERNRAEFEHHVRRRLGEVRALHLPDERLTDADREVHLLRRAIQQHRALIEQDDHDAETVDGWLYAALDGRWEFPTTPEAVAS